jgi:cell division protein FtsI (penicillin-binding protein 3)
MSDPRSNINKRIVIFGLLPLVLAIGVIIRLVNLIFISGPEIRERTESQLIKEESIPAGRGNIYSSDEKLLATSMPVFDIYMDPVSVKDADWDEGLTALSKGLARLFPEKNHLEWSKKLKDARSAGNRYVPIAKNVSYTKLIELKSLPIFKLGKYRGGLISEQKNFRKMPLDKIAERTIGYDKQNSAAGIEGAFAHVLAGVDGKRLTQRIAQGNTKPLHDGYLIEPRDGHDIVTTIDSRIQDITHHALLSALEKFEADHGTAVVMDVKTGAIRGIANLGRNSRGHYYEKRNYAVWESTEPGSTFKLASLLALLEGGKVDTTTIVDVKNGVWEIHGANVRDAYVSSGGRGLGEISLGEVFIRSSNVGFAKLIHEHYGNNPEEFVNRLYKMGLHKPLNPEIIGEGKPKIPHPNDGAWSRITLPWMAFGYETSFTPLQILSLYNAIANDGVMVKPYFVEEIRAHGKVINRFEPTVINPSIGSATSIAIVQDLLERVVNQGTAKNIRSNVYRMSGKTGTCRLEYWRTEGPVKYQASFAGYFPSENPRYSIIVVVNSPNPQIGFYGSAVAAPVAKVIADNLYVEIPEEIHPVDKAFRPQLAFYENALNEIQNKAVPNLSGVPGHQAIALLENAGINTKIYGNGNVHNQYPKPGTRLQPNTTVELSLK